MADDPTNREPPSGEGPSGRPLPLSVRLLGAVSYAERDALMRRATALVYPSLFEGFCLPPLEAMAQGTAVIASNVSVISFAVNSGNPISESRVAFATACVAPLAIMFSGLSLPRRRFAGAV